MKIVSELEKQVVNIGAREGLKVISDQYGDQARFSSALGLEDQLITYWISAAQLDIPIFTIDTGRLFQESYDLLDLTRKKYKLPIEVYFPQSADVEKLVKEKGPNSFYDSVENRKECCHIRKVEPLIRALQGASVWITGIRAEQSINRTSMKMIEWDDQNKVIKYNPLLHWTLAEVEQEISKNNIPINTLYKKGYGSIGCSPCTRAITPGENPRAGRWWWESSSKECGLHETKP